MVSYSNGKNRYCTDSNRLSQVLESFPLENLRVKTVNDREPFGADRSEVFPIPEPSLFYRRPKTVQCWQADRQMAAWSRFTLFKL